MITLNVQEIQEIIPHRCPFLLVDRVLELEPMKKGVGIKNVTMNEAHFMGHFPLQFRSNTKINNFQPVGLAIPYDI